MKARFPPQLATIALMFSMFGSGCFVDTSGGAPLPDASSPRVPDARVDQDGGVPAPDADAPCADRDRDGVCDADDGCPDDATKAAPGICGCGVPDADSDGDGAADCVDACTGGDDRVDDDGDGIPDGCDDCPIDGPTGFSATFPVAEDSMHILGASWSPGGRVPTLEAGDTVTLVVEYRVDDMPCPGCIKQIEIGAEGDAGFIYCAYDGNPTPPSSSGVHRASVRLPSATPPGFYYMVANYAEQYECGGTSGGTAWYRGMPAASTQRIAAFCVR